MVVLLLPLFLAMGNGEFNNGGGGGGGGDSGYGVGGGDSGCGVGGGDSGCGVGGGVQCQRHCLMEATQQPSGVQ